MTKRKKICLLGAFAVGKTSLVRRRVHGHFSDNYYTTIGVRIDKLSITLDRTEVHLVLWDLHGEDRFQSVQTSYLRGASGIMVVADLTRPATIDVGISLERRARTVTEGVPTVWAWNKMDLATEVEERLWASKTRELNCVGVRTSARTGEGVMEAFELLAAAVIGSGGQGVG